jgi:hypothetical protein
MKDPRGYPDGILLPACCMAVLIAVFALLGYLWCLSAVLS